MCDRIAVMNRGRIEQMGTPTDVWGAGEMGAAYEPLKGSELAGRFDLPRGVDIDRLGDREALRKRFDGLSAELDAGQAMEEVDRYIPLSM